MTEPPRVYHIKKKGKVYHVKRGDLMDPSTTLWTKLGPWLAGIIFGTGTGIGSARAYSANHEKRLRDIEEWVKAEGLSRGVHTLICQALQAETSLHIEQVVNKAVNQMGEKIITKIEKMHEHNGM